MSVEIHAAIVGGLIAGGVVLTGVLVESIARDRRDRRQRLFGLTKALRPLLARSAWELTAEQRSGKRSDEERARLARTNIELQEELSAAIAELADLVRWPMRGRKLIADATDDVLARIAAGWALWAEGTTTTAFDLLDVMDPSPLEHAVFGEHRDIAGKIKEKMDRARDGARIRSSVGPDSDESPPP